MNRTELMRKINEGAYENKRDYPTGMSVPANNVFDEEKSIKWNKEEVVRVNKEREQSRKEYREETIALHRKLKEDFIEMLSCDYNLNEKVAGKIWEKAWEDAHSEGLCSVVEAGDTIASFVNECIRQNQE